MKKAVVLGATGGMGSAIVSELLSRGIETVAFARSRQKLDALLKRDGQGHSLTGIAGDVFDLAALTEAVQGADVIFHSVNLPYQQWAERLLELAGNVMKGAARTQAKVVVIDNIYPYGRAQTGKVNEDHPKQPHTKKGKLRLEMEKLIMKADREGTPALIARFPDFYGPDAENTLLYHTLSSIAAGKRAIYVGNPDVPREFIYTPDGAMAVVELALHDDAYGQNWNIPGPGTITGREIISIAQEEVGVRKPVTAIGKKMFTFLGWFNPFMKEMVEMMYLTEQPVVLNGAKYERLIGNVPATPYEQGIKETIRALQEKSLSGEA